MRWRSLDDITNAALLELVENEVSEDRSLEYKEELPGSSDSDKREFLADVSALANGAGGDLLFGVREKRDASGAKLGVAGEIIGVPGPLDPVRARLESVIRDGISPRIPGIAMRAIDGFARGPVLVVRVPRSWTAPHMVSVSGGQRFFTRTGGGKHPMDVHELRHAFLSNQTALAAARELRAERVGRVLAEETPLRLRAGTVRWILQLVPAALDVAPQLEALELRGHEIMPRPEYVNGWNTRWNLDGYVAYASDAQGEHQTFWYGQILRTGAIESVDALMPPDRLSAGRLEHSLFHFTERAIRASRAIGVDGPWFLMATLIGARGQRLLMSERFTDMPYELHPQSRTIDRDPVLLPEVEVGAEAPLVKAIRPVCDALWQASGWPRSMHFDAGGEWKPPK